jgi:hypothetical protein
MRRLVPTPKQREFRVISSKRSLAIFDNYQVIAKQIIKQDYTRA